MPSIIEIPDTLRRFSGDASEVEAAGATVGELLEALWMRFPALRSRMLDRHGRIYPYLMLLHNEQKVAQTELASRAVQPGDRLEIVALAEGG